MTTTNENTANNPAEKSNRPTHVAKIRNGYGKNASYEQVGVAWVNEDGGIYVRLHGTQIIDKGISLYAIEDNNEGGA